jgi:riboflavin biosynthesis pyrimidine reductase
MPALQGGALIFTTKHGARRLTGRLPAGCEIVEVGMGTSVDPADALIVMRDRGHETVLSEGGPTLMGQLLEHRLVDELFLTLSPMLAGRTEPEPRPGIVEGVDLSPIWPWSELLSVRRHASHLFLRYGLSKQSSVEV